MDDSEEVLVTPDFHHNSSTGSRTGQCLVISAFPLGLVSGLFAGGLFGAMMDEAVFHFKDLPSVQALDTYRDIITMLFSTMFFFIVIISSLTGVGLGYGTYCFLISIKGQQAKAKALAGAAPVAVLGITVCGATMGSVCSKCVLKFGLILTVHNTFIFFYFFIYVFFLALYRNDASRIDCVVCSLLPGSFGFGMYLLFCSEHLALQSIYLYYFLLFSFLYVFYVPKTSNEYLKNVSFVHTVCPILLLLFTLLFFVGAGKASQTADEEGSVIVVLSTQLLEAAAGEWVYLTFGGVGAVGAGKVCAGAVAAGGAVLVSIQKASPMVDKGARLGGLIGVSGAAGVALSAAGALGQKYGEAANQVWGGKLGRTAVILGAAAGAFLSAGTSDIRLGLFKAACAAMITGTQFIRFVLNVLCHGLHSVYRSTVMGQM